MWVIRTYKCGRVVEKSKFWVSAGTRVRSGRVKGNTSAAKRDANAKQAVRMVARTLNCNFRHGDLYVTGKFDDETLAEIGGDYKTLTRLLGNFTKRLKRHLRRQGVELKWLAVPSEKDGETGSPKRLHVHMVITGAGITWREGAWHIGETTLEALWGMGGIYAEPLRDQGDYTQLAVYMLRQARRDVPDAKKYSCSRNMAKPEITERAARTARPLRNPGKTYLLEAGPYNADTGCHYIRYLVDREEDRRPGRDGP